jgi:hypothetical protein
MTENWKEQAARWYPNQASASVETERLFPAPSPEHWAAARERLNGALERRDLNSNTTDIDTDT